MTDTNMALNEALSMEWMKVGQEVYLSLVDWEMTRLMISDRDYIKEII